MVDQDSPGSSRVDLAGGFRLPNGRCIRVQRTQITTKDRPEGRPIPSSFDSPKHFEQVPSGELEILRRHHLLNFGVSEHSLARCHELIHRIT